MISGRLIDPCNSTEILGGVQTCWSWNVRESVANELVSAQGILVEYLQCEHEQVEDRKGNQEI